MAEIADGKAPGGPCRVVLLGDRRVGKSALMAQLADGVFSTDYVPTRLECKTRTARVDGQPCDVQLTDCTANEESTACRAPYIQAADAVILLYSITSRQSLLDLRQYMTEVWHARLDVLTAEPNSRVCTAPAGGSSDAADASDCAAAASSRGPLRIFVVGTHKDMSLAASDRAPANGEPMADRALAEQITRECLAQLAQRTALPLGQTADPVQESVRKREILVSLSRPSGGSTGTSSPVTSSPGNAFSDLCTVCGPLPLFEVSVRNPAEVSRLFQAVVRRHLQPGEQALPKMVESPLAATSAATTVGMSSCNTLGDMPATARQAECMATPQTPLVEGEGQRVNSARHRAGPQSDSLTSSPAMQAEVSPKASGSPHSGGGTPIQLANSPCDAANGDVSRSGEAGNGASSSASPVPPSRSTAASSRDGVVMPAVPPLDLPLATELPVAPSVPENAPPERGPKTTRSAVRPKTGKRKDSAAPAAETGDAKRKKKDKKDKKDKKPKGRKATGAASGSGLDRVPTEPHAPPAFASVPGDEDSETSSNSTEDHGLLTPPPPRTVRGHLQEKLSPQMSRAPTGSEPTEKPAPELPPPLALGDLPHLSPQDAADSSAAPSDAAASRPPQDSRMASAPPPADQLETSSSGFLAPPREGSSGSSPAGPSPPPKTARTAVPRAGGTGVTPPMDVPSTRVHRSRTGTNRQRIERASLPEWDRGGDDQDGSASESSGDELDKTLPGGCVQLNGDEAAAEQATGGCTPRKTTSPAKADQKAEVKPKPTAAPAAAAAPERPAAAAPRQRDARPANQLQESQMREYSATGASRMRKPVRATSSLESMASADSESTAPRPPKQSKTKGNQCHGGDCAVM